MYWHLEVVITQVQWGLMYKWCRCQTKGEQGTFSRGAVRLFDKPLLRSDLQTSRMWCRTGQSLCLLSAPGRVAYSVQEEVPDACCLDPGDVGSSAGEYAGFVFHSAADWTKAHHAVHFPAVSSQLAQQRTTRVTLGIKLCILDHWAARMLHHKRCNGVDHSAFVSGKPPVLPDMQRVDPRCLWTRRRSWSLGPGRPRTSFAGRSWSQ